MRFRFPVDVLPMACPGPARSSQVALAMLVWRSEDPGEPGALPAKRSVRLLRLQTPAPVPTHWVREQVWARRKLTSALGKVLVLPGWIGTFPVKRWLYFHPSFSTHNPEPFPMFTDVHFFS